MSNFVTLLVEDDALEREVLADVLKESNARPVRLLN